MATWIVKATWSADDYEECELWEASAETVADAVQQVTTRVRFPPHHVEAHEVREVAQFPHATHPIGEPRRIPPR